MTSPTSLSKLPAEAHASECYAHLFPEIPPGLQAVKKMEQNLERTNIASVTNAANATRLAQDKPKKEKRKVRANEGDEYCTELPLTDEKGSNTMATIINAKPIRIQSETSQASLPLNVKLIQKQQQSESRPVIAQPQHIGRQGASLAMKQEKKLAQQQDQRQPVSMSLCSGD